MPFGMNDKSFNLVVMFRFSNIKDRKLRGGRGAREDREDENMMLCITIPNTSQYKHVSIAHSLS